MSADNEFQPDVFDAMQFEPEGREAAVKVIVTGPVRIQDLPRKAGATFTRLAVTTAPMKLLAADHRRAAARIVSIGQNMLVALSAASAQDASRMALWPANLVFLCEADTEVWVASATATTTISVVTELWATGE
jgi:hypothetical protein